MSRAEVARKEDRDMTTKTTTAAELVDRAIAVSIREKRTVVLDAPLAATAELDVRCDGLTYEDDGSTEYWGDTDGIDWCVRLFASD